MNYELLYAGVQALEYIDCVMFLMKHRIPFEDWPPEIQGMAGISEDLLGPADKDKE